MVDSCSLIKSKACRLKCAFVTLPVVTSRTENTTKECGIDPSLFIYYRNTTYH